MAPIKAYQYQKEGVWDMEDFLEMGGGTLLADDMGLGKTLQALWLMRREKVGAMFPALVVCPASVKYGWEHEALEHLGIRTQVLEGRSPPTGGFGTVIPKITIINYDILVAWLPYLLDAGYQTLVLDECQYLGNPRSQRTKAAIDLGREIPYRLGLSGTPLTNAPGELWPTLYILRPDKFRSLFAFGEDFCRPKMEFGKRTYKGARNLPQLHALLKRTCMVRRLKEDVLHDLPDKVRQVVLMDITDREEYQYAVRDFVGWLHKHHRGKRGRAARAARAIAVVRVGYLVRLAARLKARAVVDWVNRWLEAYPDEKIVLFGIHKKMLRLLERRVNAPHVTIDGRVTGRKRKAAKDRFIHDPSIRVLIGNMMSAGVGIDGLQAVCNTAAFCELWWVPGKLTQAEDRIYRIGQDQTAWIHYLVAGGTIEEDLCRIVQNKQKDIHATLDGADFESDMDVFDQLIAILEA